MRRLIGTLAVIVVIAINMDRCVPAKNVWRASTESTSEACLIKGNISQNTGERIYHVPGQEWYGKTVIDTSRGERWFCSEDEAQRAGWRRAYK